MSAECTPQDEANALNGLYRTMRSRSRSGLDKGRLCGGLMSPLKLCDPSVALPKFHVLALHQSDSAVFSFVFVGAEEVYAIEDMAIRPNDVRAVLLHLRTLGK